ncbi:UNVERIFIED_CONTAM: hypothetical protein FKN15_072780 [Acipenser sinensis]
MTQRCLRSVCRLGVGGKSAEEKEDQEQRELLLEKPERERQQRLVELDLPPRCIAIYAPELSPHVPILSWSCHQADWTMYFYFTWPKMNASAAGGDGSGVLPSSSTSCNKRGSGAPLVNGNEASAAPAGVTATTPGAGFAVSADSVRPQVCGYSNNIHNISNNNKSDNVTALNSKESTIGSGGTGSADVPECEVDCYIGVNGSGEEMKKTDSSITDDKNSNDGDSKTGDGRCVFVTTPAVRTTGTVLAASTSCTSSKWDPDSSLVLPRSAGDGTGQSEAATNTGERTINTACFLAMHHYQGSRWEGKRLCFPSSTNSRATHCSKAPTKSGESGFKEPAAPAAVYSSATSSFPSIINSSNGPHTAFGNNDRIIGVPCCGKEDSSDKIACENSRVSSRSRSCRREPKSAKGRAPLGSKGKTVINNGVSLEPTKSTNGFRKALDLTMCGAGADCVDGVEGACTSELPSLGELEAGAREAVKRQAEMEVRALRICKRLQVVQAKQVERHAVQQLKGLVESVLRGDCTLPGGGASVQGQDTLYRTSPLLCNALQAGPSHFGKHPFLPRTTSPLSLPLFPAQLGSGEMSWLVGSLGAALRTVETAFDSDATASSSGGESDVEERELGAARPTHRHRPLTVETAFDSDATASSSGGESDVEERELGAARPTHRHRPLLRHDMYRNTCDGLDGLLYEINQAINDGPFC